MCNKKITDIVIGAIVIIFALYQTTYSNWIIIIAGAALIIHALACKGGTEADMSAKPTAKAKK